VLIEDCFYSGGDDAVAVKSGEIASLALLHWPSYFLSVHCGVGFLQASTGGVALLDDLALIFWCAACLLGLSIGSEMSGGIQNVTFADTTVTGES
jgi:polygalacturonase